LAVFFVNPLFLFLLYEVAIYLYWNSLFYKYPKKARLARKQNGKMGKSEIVEIGCAIFSARGIMEYHLQSEVFQYSKWRSKSGLSIPVIFSEQRVI